MPIYLPALFCGEQADLRLKRNINWENQFIREGETCHVEKITGYIYDVIFSSNKSTFRVHNEVMHTHFEIINEGKKEWIGFNKQLLDQVNSSKVILKESFIIKDVVTIDEGTAFYPIEEMTHDGRKFWDLYEATTFERILRLKDEEYIKYF